jgi:uncharacterized iron-regulated membrane protein
VRKLIFNLHLYTALVAGIFVVILGVTGSIMAFEDQLDRIFNPALFTVQPGTHKLPIPQLLDTLRGAFPGQKFNGLHTGSKPNESYYTGIKGGQAFVNPYTGQILGTRTTPTVLGNIHQLHLRLLLGPTGKSIVNIVAFTLVWLVISGLYLWWPLKRARISFGASFRRLVFDTHHAVGIYAALFLLAAGLTGIGIHFDDAISEWLNERTHSKAPVRMVPSTPIEGVKPITPDEAIARALDALPGTSSLSYGGPNGPRGSYYVVVHFPEDLTPGGRSWVVVDQYSGKPLFIENSRTAPAGTWTIIQNRAIHTGDILGYPSKIAMSLSCFMLIVQALTGYYLWLKINPNPSPMKDDCMVSTWPRISIDVPLGSFLLESFMIASTSVQKPPRSRPSTFA